MAVAPLLSGDKLTLKPFSPEFLTERYVGWLNNPLVVQYSEQRHHSHSVESCAAYVKSFEISPHFLWVLETPEFGHVGNLAATIDIHNQRADLAILLGETTIWGKGYGREAWQRVSDWLLTSGGLRKITAGTMARNQGMLKIFWATGMVEEGRRPRHFLWQGDEVDLIFAGRYREG